MRKLASIQSIHTLSPIENADFIVKAGVLGWDVVVKKDDFQVGDKCVFLEIDSILPQVEWAEFMRPRHFRVKTVRLRNVLSQGLALPLSILPSNHVYQEDDDVTEILGVVKYEPALHNGGKHLGCSAGNFPIGIPKTDETRLQSTLRIIQELKEAGSFYVTVKVDGTSSTFCYEGEEFICASRNFKKKEDDTNIYWKMARKYKLAEVLATYKNLVIQGEIAGPGIQGNKLSLKEQDLFVFDIYDTEKKEYFGFEELFGFCKEHELTTVPLLCTSIDPGEAIPDKSGFLKLAEGKYSHSTNDREGIVVRPFKTTRSPTLQGKRLSFKVINNQFLLKNGDA